MIHRYLHRFPDLVIMAQESKTIEQFKISLINYISSGKSEIIKERIKALIDNNDCIIEELSTGEKIHIKTITYLWQFLNGKLTEEVSDDLFLDLYKQFKLLKNPDIPIPDHQRVRRWMSRWQCGLDAEVIAIREKNKDRIIRCLIKKIDKRTSPHSKYFFPKDISFEEKYRLVTEWWNSSRFHLSTAIKSPTELNAFLNNSLSEATMALLQKGKKKGMPFFITPYYISLLNPYEDGYDDLTIRSYILYSEELVETYGNIKAWEKEDEVEPGKPNAAGWLLPESNNIHRRYPEVAILIPDSMGRACGGLCASCQRMYDFQSERLNFNFEDLKPKESWEKKLRRLMLYFEEDSQLRDILITGGDALMSQNSTLRRILEAVYKMAVRKMKANESRPDGEKYAELQRVRLGSRLPAYLPMRINEELIHILSEFKEKASSVGVSQFYIQTHFQSPLEVTPEAKRAIKALQSAGWTVTNQLVFNVAASRRGHTAKLRQVLHNLGIVPYYTFSVKGFRENYDVFAPNARSLQEAKEEKACLSHTVRTDRNVLNLPAIGKSMTFTTVGISSQGQRILKFNHDLSRKHSPIIDKMAHVYIVENKSIAAYLRQLKEIGEEPRKYESIWNYCEGLTEKRNPIYKYPEFPFDISEHMSNYTNPE
ncbi:KamA family protein [Bacteroidales bacterium OttesenSCG-928-I14]|nr:KamA family protein [Bacteroidales bacterium OttesenSCG-928-I14]